MSFQDLPENWPDLPLTDARLVADVLDLVVGSQARRLGAMVFVVCDEAARLRQPIQIDDVDQMRADERHEMCDGIVTLVAELDPDATLLVARARSGGLSVTADDDAWRAVVERSCLGRLSLLGVHVVTPDGSRPIPRVAAPPTPPAPPASSAEGQSVTTTS